MVLVFYGTKGNNCTLVAVKGTGGFDYCGDVSTITIQVKSVNGQRKEKNRGNVKCQQHVSCAGAPTGPQQPVEKKHFKSPVCRYFATVVAMLHTMVRKANVSFYRLTKRGYLRVNVKTNSWGFFLSIK